jgi:parallel beta-helix repeat protein
MSYKEIMMNLCPLYPSSMDHDEHRKIDRKQGGSIGLVRIFLGLILVSTILAKPVVKPVSAQGADCSYYVSPSGDDGNSGQDIDHPWRTLAKANSTLQAGDTLCIREGTYQEDINPLRSGTPEARIVYRNYENEQVTLRGVGAGGDEGVVAIGWPGSTTSWGSKSYIVIEGLTIDPTDARYGIIIYGSSSIGNIIRNCTILNHLGGKRDGILIGEAQDTLIENNHIDGNWRLGIITTSTPRRTIIRGNTILNSTNSGIDIQTSYGTIQGTLIEENVIGLSQVEDGIQFEPDYSLGKDDPGLNRGVIIRDNVIFENAENAIDLKGADDIVIENNQIWSNRGDNDGSGNRGGGSAIMRGLESKNSNILIRHNVIYDNCGGIDINSSNWTVVHNTILGNNRDYEGPKSDWDGTSGGRPIFIGVRLMYQSDNNEIRNVIIKNNIIAGHHQGEIAIRTTADLNGTGLDGNLYFNDEQVRLVDMDHYYYWDEVDFTEWKNRLLTVLGLIATDQNSSTENPSFQSSPVEPVGEGPFDFSLQSNSQAIDRGLFLTRTLSSGSGTLLPVENARFFSDGYGVTAGDEIQLASTGQRGTILSIDFLTNTLTLDRDLTWEAGQGVSLPYEGSAPDIGAYEYPSGSSPEPTFADVPFDHWAYDYIEALYQDGYVAGCSMDPLLYCPESILTRAESAVFVERGIHGADTLPDQPAQQLFDDVPLEEWFAKWTTALWDDGYTSGCGTDPLIYCPLQDHTRAEGSVFFLRMMHGMDYVPPDPVGLFADVPAEAWYADWVEAAFNAGIVPACETEPELRFCPEDPLDRAMAAYMMVQAKGLSIP